jgi:hypothetical protein
VIVLSATTGFGRPKSPPVSPRCTARWPMRQAVSTSSSRMPGIHPGRKPHVVIDAVMRVLDQARQVAAPN